MNVRGSNNMPCHGSVKKEKIKLPGGGGTGPEPSKRERP